MGSVLIEDKDKRDFDKCFFCLADCTEKDYLYVQRKNISCCEGCADLIWDRLLEYKVRLRQMRSDKLIDDVYKRMHK